jgi:polyhydroxyalkanoate synthesis regulator phasin
MNDRIRILEMVKEGKITPEEGARLLEALDRQPRATSKMLRVRIHSPGGQKVELNIPLSAAHSVVSVLPPRARAKLESMGLNLDQLLRAVQEGAAAGRIVDIRDPGGAEISLVVE